MHDRETIEAIFLEAVPLAPEDCTRFLEKRCGDDLALRAEVEKLIAADRLAGDDAFLRTGLFGKGRKEPVADGPPDDVAIEDRRFRLLRGHREGGLGEVLIAHDRELDREVAVKQIKPRWKDSREARQRFVQEAKVTGRLEHPGIVPVYAMGTWEDGQHYYAMRFIEGETMKDAIEDYHRPCGPATPAGDASLAEDDARRLRLRELLARFIDVCNTIQYAHSKEVLHRDIKPSNIMVGPYGETLVVDWGLAKLLDEPSEESMTADLARAIGLGSGSTPTMAGGTVGTPQYMSPEQAAGKLDEIGTSTDVYLLGATLYQILAGRPPHQGDSLSALLKQIAGGELKRPSAWNPDVAPALESICLKAMAADPRERYSDPAKIAEDVNRWMADQPVSVHRDSNYVRLNRWMRRHRTTTSSAAVAILLLSIGSVFGSLLWSAAKEKAFQAEEAKRSKERELDLKDRQRIAELSASATSSEQLANEEIERNRFSAALNVLRNTLQEIGPDPGLAEQTDRIRQKVERLDAVVEFYRLADVVEQQNVLSRDTKALLACTTALKKLGVWERADWWTVLPDDFLSPQQIDTLRWDVYQQLMLMDAMLVKSIGTRLAGDEGIGGWVGMLKMGLRAARTDLGKAEARAALIVSDRIDRFRLSESTRLYRSLAGSRLGRMRSSIKGGDLGTTSNGADAHSLAVLCMISAIDPGFKVVFGSYQGEDSLVAAQSLFARAATLQPGYYGAHLGLGQLEYLIANQREDLRWEDLNASQRAFTHCITLLPNRCFAYADRSSIYRIQASLIASDERYDLRERRRRSLERLNWSLSDAERAMEFYAEHPWVGWQIGHTHEALGDLDRALSIWIKTAFDVYSLGRLADMTFVGVDDARGRGEIGDWLEQKLNSSQDRYRSRTTEVGIALAGVRLNQGRMDEAKRAIKTVLQADPDNLNARAMYGALQLREQRFADAKVEFEAVFRSEPDHPIASFGLASCLEQAGEYSEAITLFQHAERVLLTGENKAAAALGLCRSAVMLKDFDLAAQSISRAVAIEPACDLYSLARHLLRTKNDWRRNVEGNVGASESKRLLSKMDELIRLIGSLPRASKIDTMPPADLETSVAASLLNGDFELGSMRYWEAPSGAPWQTTVGFQSSATVTPQQAYSGSHSLRIQAAKTASDGTQNSFGPMSARTGQTISVVAGQRYEVSCWVKAESLSEGAIEMVGSNEDVLIEFDSGSYPWRRIRAEFRTEAVPKDSAASPPPILPYPIQIVARGSGTIWLDDLRCVSKP